MPNWFYFTVSVHGEDADVQEFVQNVKGTDQYETSGRDFDFNHFIPQPDNIFRDNLSFDTEKKLSAQGIPNWYRWNIDNWGTKWNACCDDRDFNGTSVTYQLSTAWSFPTPVIEKMIEKYPNLQFEIEGEEEACAYGVYIDSSRDIWNEEEPDFVDEQNNKEVYWHGEDNLWRYLENDEVVADAEDFYPQTRYSWSE